jgi:hypothetical protein
VIYKIKLAEEALTALLNAYYRENRIIIKSELDTPSFCFENGKIISYKLNKENSQSFLKPLPVGEHVIYFKGGLKSINATATGGSNSNYTFAGPYGWDSPVTYHLTITKS